MKNEASDVDLLAFYDDFVEFNDYCSFLCDALSALFSEYAEDELDAHTIQGVKRHCSDIKERAEQLESALNKLYKQQLPHTYTQITSLKPRT